MEKRVLITGANGQVGQSLIEILRNNRDIKAIAADRRKLDIGNPEQVEAFFRAHKLDGCINCAAYTAVDQAESEPQQAQLINTLGPVLLASHCKDQSIPFIHLSTDYVYHDTSITPLTEEAEVNPQSVYARTKYEGDLATLQAGGTVVRTSWVYAPWGKNFLRTMLHLGEKRDQLSVVFDQIGSPTYAPDLAQVLVQLMEKSWEATDQVSGIYHFSNEGVCSWYDFAHAIFDLAGLECELLPIRSAQYPTPAERPPYSVLDKAKIKALLGIQIPHWRDSLSGAIGQIINPPQPF